MNKGIKIVLLSIILSAGAVFGKFIFADASTGIIPQTAALFQAQLSSGIAANATSMTLSTNLIPYFNEALSPGYYSFIIDQGTPDVEVVEGNVSGTSVTGLVRGIDPQNPNVTSTAFAFQHSAGAYVQITVYSWLQHVSRILQGLDTEVYSMTFATTTQYSSSVTTSSLALNGQAFASVNYVNGVAIQGSPAASTSTPGISLLAQGSQIYHGLDGSPTHYVPPSSLFNSVASTSPIAVVASGTIDPSFLSGGNYPLGSTTVQSITSASTTLNGATTFGSVTSTIIAVNASGTVGSVGTGASTGSILQYYNGKWNVGLLQTITFQTSTLPTNTGFQGIATATLPLAASTSIIDFTDNIGFTGNSATSTIHLINGAASTTLAVCGGNTNVQAIFGLRIVIMGTPSAAYLTGNLDNANGCNVSTAFTSIFSNYNFATTTYITVTGSSPNLGSTTWSVTSTVSMIQ